jgi:hypothetical protein
MKRRTRRGRARTEAPVKMPPELESVVLRVDNAIVDEIHYDYLIGDAWNQLKTRALKKQIRQVGETNAKVFWDKYINSRVKWQDAQILGRLVDHFDQVAFGFSMRMLACLLKYCRRSGVEPWRDPREQPIHVPRPGDTFEDVPFAKCTPAEIQTALDALPAPRGKGKPKPKLPPVAHKIVVEALKRLNDVIVAGATFSARMAKDVDVYSLTGVPRTLLRKACKDLLDALDAAGA